jgi:TolB-like protein/DNA-binding winged helix-turn-helix (wHTH) protein/Flp pilus assembly protein TadD
MMHHGTPNNAEQLRLGASDYIWRDGQLQDACGRNVPLRAKSLKMFTELLAKRGRILTKDRLSDLVWPGTIATDESIARCIADIRKALLDDTHRIVQTFPKQGYRLNVLIAAGDRVNPPSSRRRLGVTILVALCAVTIMAVGQRALEIRTQSQDSLALTVAPASDLREAVAILPLSAQAQSYLFLAAGLSDDLEIRLAELSNIKVISQAQSGVIADMSQSPAALASSLDVRYLVQGSFRQSGENVSLSIRLIDGADGVTLWADRYEGSRLGLMDFRETLPEALVGAMSIELNARDRRRLAVQDTNDPEAFAEVMHARRELSTFSYQGSLAAERHLRRAIALDPGYARAYAELASAFVIRMENDWIVISSADTEKAFYFAEKATDLDPDLWFAHFVLGRLHSVAQGGDTEAALWHLRKAMSLQPANDDARVYFAIVTAMAGRIEEGAAIMESVMATNPQPPFWYYLGLANVRFHQRRYGEAADAVSDCLQQMPNSPYCLRIQIAVLTRLGRLEDAMWAIEEYAILGHDLTLGTFMKSAIESDLLLRAHLRKSYEMAGIE